MSETRPIYKILNNLSKRINEKLKELNIDRDFTYTQILGCKVKDFENYLLNKMIDGMSFENYGAWEVDHIIPFSSFDFHNIERIFRVYTDRIAIIEKEISDIEEIEMIIERDLAEIIEKEKEYEKVSKVKSESKKISLLLEEKAKFEKDLEELGVKYHNEILMYKKNLSFLIPYLNATQNTTHTKLFSIINCWVISKNFKQLQDKIQKITSNKCIIFSSLNSVNKSDLWID